MRRGRYGRHAAEKSENDRADHESESSSRFDNLITRRSDRPRYHVQKVAGARGQLKAWQPQQFKVLERATAGADRVRPRHVGAAMLEQMADEFAEPKLVKAFGELPAGFAA